jgi:hypothetical protein
MSTDINLQFAHDARQLLKMRNCQLVKMAMLHVVNSATWCDDNGIKINAGSVIGLGKLRLNIHDTGPHTEHGFSHRRGDICLLAVCTFTGHPTATLGGLSRGSVPTDRFAFLYNL